MLARAPRLALLILVALSPCVAHAQPAPSSAASPTGRASGTAGALDALRADAPGVPPLAAPTPPAGARPPRDPAPPVIDDALADLLERTGATEHVPVLLSLRSDVPAATIERLADSPARRAAIVTRLRAASASAMRPLTPLIESLESSGELGRVRPVWIAGAVAVDATPEAVRTLASHRAVVRIRHLPRRDAFAARAGRPGAQRGLALPSGRRSALQGVGSVDWGTRRIGAERVTREIGLSGRGVVVAVIDSGVCWRHPDIGGRVHVNPGEDLDGDGALMDEDDLDGVDNDGNGFVDDLAGWDIDDGDNDPDDERSGHGSHVGGSVAGDGSSGYRAGVAPGASILPIRVGTFSGDEADTWRGIEYALLAGADVINLSMGWRHVWGTDRATWRRVVDAVTAAGVPFVVAAGNEGWDVPPGSIRSPGDVPSAITVGSTDVRDELADDSSVGPVTWENVAPYGDFPLPEGLVKPDVVAPGVEIESHARCGGTEVRSGTSMATPHVAGTIALLLEADPGLGVEEIRELLRETAVDLGPPGPDNGYGHGRIDAFAAAERANARLRHGGHAVRDAATGNGTGALDPGETAALSVTLVNASGDSPAEIRSARLVSETDGLAVVREAAFYPVIPAGEARDPDGPLPLVRSDLPCGAPMTLRLDVEHADGRRSRTRFALRSGASMPAVLVDESFDAGAAGWEADSDAESGDFVLTALRSGPAFTTGGEDGAVTGGEVRLVSPAFDASLFESLTLTIERAAAVDGGPRPHPENEDPLLAGAPFDTRALAAFTDAPRLFAVEVSDDDGRSWVPVDVVTRGRGEWRSVRRPLGALAGFSGAVRLRVRVADVADGADAAAGGAGERRPRTAPTWGAVRAVRLEGARLTCAPAP